MSDVNELGPARVLGLDVSLTATGAALVTSDGAAAATRLLRPPAALRGVERLAWLADAVLAVARETQPDLIAIEGYSFNSRAASHAHAIGEAGGVVRLELHRAGFGLVEVPPAEWRKQLFGRGNLPKDLVRVEAWKRYGVEHSSLDVLEAWCVGTAALRRAHGLDGPAPQRRRRPS